MREETIKDRRGRRDVAELLHAEVLEHEQVDARELLDEIAARAGGLRLGEVRGEVKGAPDERAATGTDRADGDGGGDVRFADAGRNVSSF